MRKVWFPAESSANSRLLHVRNGEIERKNQEVREDQERETHRQDTEMKHIPKVMKGQGKSKPSKTMEGKGKKTSEEASGKGHRCSWEMNTLDLYMVNK